MSLHLFHLLYPFLACLPCDFGCRQETELKPKSRPFERWKYSYPTHGTRNTTGSYMFQTRAVYHKCVTIQGNYLEAFWWFSDVTMPICVGLQKCFLFSLESNKIWKLSLKYLLKTVAHTNHRTTGSSSHIFRHIRNKTKPSNQNLVRVTSQLSSNCEISHTLWRYDITERFGSWHDNG